MRIIDPEKHQAKKQMILKAAKTCFAEKGFHQTTTAQICVAAGISTGNLFHYYPNKKAIITALFEEDRQQTQAFVAVLREEPDVLAALHGFLDMVLDIASDNTQAALVLEIAAEAGRDAEIGLLYQLNDTLLREELEYLVALGIERKQITVQFPASTLVHCLMVVVDGIFSRVSVDRGFKPQTEKPALLAMLSGLLGNMSGIECSQ